MTNQTGSRTVSRRSVAKGMAWAVPAVAVGSALPAAAAVSPGSCVPEIVIDASRSCKWAAGNNDYKLFFSIGGTGCPPDVDCDLDLTQIKEDTGGPNAEVLWQGNNDGTTGIVICDTDNMANYVRVTATVICGNETYTFDNVRVAMPSLPSVTSVCTEADFQACAADPIAPAGPGESSTETDELGTSSSIETSETSSAPLIEDSTADDEAAVQNS